MIIIYIFVVILVIIIYFLALEYWYMKQSNKDNKISFKTAMELAELPVVVFYHNDTKLNFLLDTGSNNSIIDKGIIDSIEHQKHEDIKYKLCGNEGHNTIIDTAISFDISHNNTTYNNLFQVVDMSAAFNEIKTATGVTVHGILGNAFFTKYQYVLDFDLMIAYSKK